MKRSSILKPARQRSKPWLLLLPFLGAVLVAVGACQEPTQITLEVSTEVPCSSVTETAIAVGRGEGAETASFVETTEQCDQDSQRIGSLVLVPSGETDEEVSIRVVLGFGKTAEACVEDGYLDDTEDVGCIVARRRVSFEPQTPLTLPISLTVSCIGVPCEPNETCVDGTCVDSRVNDPRSCPEPGGCDRLRCTAGTADCDDDPQTCETNTLGDPSNCGRCGLVCDNEHGATECVDGRCSPTCDDGFDDCDGLPENGCEHDVRSDPDHCGACGAHCTSGGHCAGATCSTIDCPSHYANCNGSESDGCETNLESIETCGTCATTCSDNNGTPECNGEGCLITCAESYGDCDGQVSTGCETNLVDDLDHCGDCGIACKNPHGTTACRDSRCQPECDANFDDCDGRRENGCETDLRSSAEHCGACDARCSFPNASGACQRGECVPDDCESGFADCDDEPGCETELGTTTHCRSCGETCSNAHGSTACNRTTGCTPTCDDDWKSCDGVPNNGCETPLGTTDDCADCDESCTNDNGTTACLAGMCVPACNSLTADCENPNDGCETSTASDEENCGACGRACQTGASAHVGANTCSAGTCNPTCLTGYGNCDSEPWDGCETDLTSVQNCGGCGRDCAGTACDASGTTSCCVPGIFRCQADITLTSNSVSTVSVAGSVLTFAHTPVSGENRLVVVLIAAESGGALVAASRPEIVTYGGTPMTRGPEQDGGTDFWSVDLFAFYADESMLSGKVGSQPIIIDGGLAPNPTAIAADVIQLGGVRQTNPISEFAGAVTGLAPSDPTTLASTVSVPVGASLVMLSASLWGAVLPTPSVSPSSQITLTSTMAASLSAGGTVLSANGAYADGPGGPNALAAGSYSAGWTWSYADQASHLALVVHPAQQ